MTHGSMCFGIVDAVRKMTGVARLIERGRNAIQSVVPEL